MRHRTLEPRALDPRSVGLVGSGVPAARGSASPLARCPVRPVASALPVELEYGRFTDGRSTFAVRQTTSVPDTIRVHAIGIGPRDYWTLVLTNVGEAEEVTATWCGNWARYSAAWKSRTLGHAFALFYQNRPRKLLRAAGGLR